MLPLRHLRLIRREDERQVRVDRTREAERFLDEYLPRRIGYVVFPADDMRDACFPIVGDDGEMVERIIYRTRDHEILELCRIEGDIAAHDIVEDDDGSRISQAYDFDRARRIIFCRLF